MTFFEKIALWMFINRLKINLTGANKYQRLCSISKDFANLDSFYLRVLEQITDEMTWVKRRDSTINFNLQISYINNRRKQNSEKRREFLNGNS